MSSFLRETDHLMIWTFGLSAFFSLFFFLSDQFFGVFPLNSCKLFQPTCARECVVSIKLNCTSATADAHCPLVNLVRMRVAFSELHLRSSHRIQIVLVAIIWNAGNLFAHRCRANLGTLACSIHSHCHPV